MTTQHTPTPWILDIDPENEDAYSVFFDNGKGAMAEIAGRICEPVNAAFIVRACNAHDNLVRLLEEALTTINWESPTNESLIGEMLIAIRDAKGG